MSPLMSWNGAVNGIVPTASSMQPTSFDTGVTPWSPTNALMTGVLQQPTYASIGQTRGPQQRGSSLIDTAPSYSYPLTSGLLSQAQGLLSSLASQSQPSQSSYQQSLYRTPAAYNGPNYSQIALQMAGNPHAGPYAQVAPPSGVGVPGPGAAGQGGTGTSGSSSSWPSILGGLLGVLGNPQASQGLGNIASSVGGLLKGLLGSSSASSGLPAGGSLNSGIGAPIDTTGLQNSNGYSSFDNFANSSGFDPVTGLYTPTTGDPYSFLGGDSSNPFGMNSGYDPTTGTYDSFDTGDPYSLFSGAGGQAAAITGGGSGVSSAPLSIDALNALGAYQGLTSGNPIGEAAGALDAAKLYGGAAGNAGVSAGAGAGLGALGIYSGLQQGGVAGDTQAALGSAQLAGQAANAGYLGSSGAASALGTLGSVVGAVAPLVGAGIYAAQTPAYTLGPQYYGRVNDSFNQLVSKGISDPQFMANYDQLVNAQNTTNSAGENMHNAMPLSPDQMQQLQSMYQQYLAKYMPQSSLWNWSGNNAPAGPPVRSGGGGGSIRRSAQ